jgi:hypothetical protein
VNALQTLAQAAGVAYSAGLNLYATIGIIGLAGRLGWIGPLPGSLAAFTSWWVITLALGLTAIELFASLVPAVASIWDTVHSFIRPPAAAALAAATAWHGDPVFVLVAALIGGGVGATTHTTKLGLRYAVDASPEPVSNGIMSVSELGLVSAVMIAVWNHPYITLALALTALLGVMLLVRLIWRTLKQAFSGRWSSLRGASANAAAPDRATNPDES